MKRDWSNIAIFSRRLFDLWHEPSVCRLSSVTLLHRRQRFELVGDIFAPPNSTGTRTISLHIVYQAIIQSKIVYALPAFAGQLTAMDITRVDALARKAKRRGLAIRPYEHVGDHRKPR